MAVIGCKFKFCRTDELIGLKTKGKFILILSLEVAPLICSKRVRKRVQSPEPMLMSGGWCSPPIIPVLGRPRNRLPRASVLVRLAILLTNLDQQRDPDLINMGKQWREPADVSHGPPQVCACAYTHVNTYPSIHLHQIQT